MPSNGWQSISIPRIGARSLARRSDEVLERIARAGITVPSDNRISRAAKEILQLDDDAKVGIDVDPADVDRQKLLVEAHRTLFESFVVLFARSDRPNGAQAITKDHLRAFLDGRDLPHPSSDRARDFQFEAYVGACLALSGLTVKAREPDIELRYHSEVVGVAVKRLTSSKPERVYDRVREASNQLRDSQGVGFVAVNLDNWLAGPLRGESAEQIGREFTVNLRAAYAQISKLASRPALRGTIIFANWSSWDFSESRSRFALQMGFQTLVLTDSDEDEADAEKFFLPAFARLTNSFAELGKLISPRR